jgi:26S proteasome regulatory subunit N10
MVLEAVMVVVDNSESSRNGDYQPTRFDSQVDAVNVLFQSITQGNPESSVGLMSMGGKGPEVLVTLTTEQGKILEGLHRTKKKIGGSSHLKTGIQVATVCTIFWNNGICTATKWRSSSPSSTDRIDPSDSE